VLALLWVLIADVIAGFYADGKAVLRSFSNFVVRQVI
jgi:hypothetical protein